MSDYISQLKSYDCGPTAVYNLLVFLNKYESLDNISIGSEEGTSLIEISDFLCKKDIEVDYEVALNPFKIFNLVQSGTPIIIGRFSLFGSPHIELLIPFNKKEICVINPMEHWLPAIHRISKLKYFLTRIGRQFICLTIKKCLIKS